MTRKDGWTDSEIARLKALWAEGHSTAEIGRRMKRSKNAAVGKAKRLGLEGRPSPILPPRPVAPAPRVPRAQPLAPGARTLPPLPSEMVA